MRSCCLNCVAERAGIVSGTPLPEELNVDVKKVLTGGRWWRGRGEFFFFGFLFFPFLSVAPLALSFARS